MPLFHVGQNLFLLVEIDYSNKFSKYMFGLENQGSILTVWFQIQCLLTMPDSSNFTQVLEEVDKETFKIFYFKNVTCLGSSEERNS